MLRAEKMDQTFSATSYVTGEGTSESLMFLTANNPADGSLSFNVQISSKDAYYENRTACDADIEAFKEYVLDKAWGAEGDSREGERKDVENESEKEPDAEQEG